MGITSGSLIGVASSASRGPIEFSVDRARSLARKTVVHVIADRWIVVAAIRRRHLGPTRLPS